VTVAVALVLENDPATSCRLAAFELLKVAVSSSLASLYALAQHQPVAGLQAPQVGSLSAIISASASENNEAFADLALEGGRLLPAAFADADKALHDEFVRSDQHHPK